MHGLDGQEDPAGLDAAYPKAHAKARAGARRRAGAANNAEFDRANTVVQVGRTQRTIVNVHERKPEPEVVVPMQLPGPSLWFTDREELLAWLSIQWEGSRRRRTAQISLVLGPPGIGKEAAVRYWADLIREDFAGGILYVDCAPAPGMEVPGAEGTTDVTNMLGEAIRNLGVPAEAVLSSLSARRGQYTSLTSRRAAMLVVVVHATHPQQVEALVPRAPGSLVLVTSDRPEIGNLRDEGGTQFTLRGLDEASAVELFAKVCGSARVVGHESLVADLVRRCEGWPNAVLILAKRLDAAPGLSLAEMVEELADPVRRLDALTYRGKSATTGLTWAYERLPSPARHLYRLLGTLPFAFFGAEVAAVLTGADADSPAEVRKTRRLLDEELAAGFFLEHRAKGRYALGWLTGPHAALMAELDEHVERRDAALYGVIRHYLIRAAQADRAVMGDDRARAANLAPLLAERPDPFAAADRDARRAAGLAWLDAERANFVPLLEAAARNDWHDEAWQLAEALMAYYFNRRPLGEWVAAATVGIEAAHHRGNIEAEARLRLGVSRAYTDLGQPSQAREQIDKAKSLAEGTNDEALQGSAWEFQGRYLMSKEEFERALHAYDRAYELNVSASEWRGAALAQYFAGTVLVGLGRPAEALDRLARARQTLLTRDDDRMASRTLIAIGEAQAALGLTADAMATLETAAAQLHGLHYEAQAQELLARVSRQAGDPASAREHLIRAMDLYQGVGHPRADDLATELDAE